MNRLKLTLPIEDIEEGAMNQINKALEFPFLKTLAIMRDVHQGYDLPIGAVALLDGYIWPGAVGYDIGCGMCHITTDHLEHLDYNLGDPNTRLDMLNRLEQIIPVGFNERNRPTRDFLKFNNASKIVALKDAVNYKASLQIGTLGGGNHFIEIGTDYYGYGGITIHSGSRRCGWLIADYYMKMSKGPIPIDSELGQAYLQDMNWALQFALDNRTLMMKKVLEAFGLDKKLIKGMINENHNHAEVTSEGVLHRKGATSANIGQFGVIPANMRDGVYVTKGLGNEEYLCSAPHGAGRAMSRGQAKRDIDYSVFKKQMNEITVRLNEHVLDEAPDAYKNIDYVLDGVEEVLVDVVNHFKPLIVLKG